MSRPLLQTGDVVDHFKIQGLLGRGGMGEVYLARDTMLGRRVALKVLHPKYVDSPQAAAQVLQEARTTARFNHPNIITIYAVGMCGQGYMLGPGVGVLLTRMVRGDLTSEHEEILEELSAYREFGGEEKLK